MLTRTCTCGAANRIPPGRLADTARCGRCKASLPPQSAPIAVRDVATFDAIVRDATVPVLVDFWAAWCGPCRMVAPEVERAAAAVAGRAVVLKVDTEALPQLAQRYRISGIPAFKVFRGGKEVAEQVGAVQAGVLIELVTR